MEVAVGIHCLARFTGGQRKGGLRRLPRGQCCSVKALVCLQHHPLYPVLGQHGVFHFPDSHTHSVCLHLNSRHMLFHGGVYTARLQRLHRLAAAHHRHLRIRQLCNDIAAVGTTIKCHKNIPFFFRGTPSSASLICSCRYTLSGASRSPPGKGAYHIR